MLAIATVCVDSTASAHVLSDAQSQLLTLSFSLMMHLGSSASLVCTVIVSGQVLEHNYSYYLGFAHLAAGLTNGLSSLAAGICVGIVGDAGVRATGQNVRSVVGCEVELNGTSYACLALCFSSSRLLYCCTRSSSMQLSPGF